MTSFYTEKELSSLGLKKYGRNVKISRHASIYGAQNISIGDNVRIDDFCILSGHIELGSYIHIAAYSALYGGEAGIFISDFANLSSRISVYSVSDDYSGTTLTSPMIPDKNKHVISKPYTSAGTSSSAPQALSSPASLSRRAVLSAASRL